MSDFLGDPRFPSKAMRDPSRALKIEYFQSLYKQYSRLDFTRHSDLPFAIAGLDRRLREAFDTRGGFGIFDDGDRPPSENGLFHRSLLWKRSEEDADIRAEVRGGRQPIMKWLEPIENKIWVPSWSWMAYKGPIDYMNVPYGIADWEIEEIIPPWTKGRMDSVTVVGNEVVLAAIVRGFNTGGSKSGECKLTYDLEHSTMLNGQHGRCVIVARSRNPKEEGRKKFFVLLVAAQEIAGETVYKRAGVGVILGRFIALGTKDGVAASIA
jgi:hypothetical protein